MPFDLDAALRESLRLGASDLHLKVPSSPRVRVDGVLYDLAGHGPVTAEDTERVVAQVLRSPRKREQFERAGSADLSYVVDEGRFRVAAFRQRGAASFVFRVVGDAPDAEVLGLPPIIEEWSQAQRGLIVVTGPTGSGKSTTTACLLGIINEHRACHIVTIEDPVEFLHTDRRALVSQREIGVDAPSYHEALRAALRQDPDVIMVGEIRDEETAVTALRAAETGHLVVCTMHTIDAPETVQRFIDLFAHSRSDLARRMLAATLVGIISQRLVPGAAGGRRLNAEVLVNSARVRDLIAGDAGEGALRTAISEGDFYGMCTFDQSLLEQVREGRVDEGDALAIATNAHDFKLLLQRA
jgi:twitching motility protein PilT